MRIRLPVPEDAHSSASPYLARIFRNRNTRLICLSLSFTAIRCFVWVNCEYTGNAPNLRQLLINLPIRLCIIEADLWPVAERKRK